MIGSNLAHNLVAVRGVKGKGGRDYDFGHFQIVRIKPPALVCANDRAAAAFEYFNDIGLVLGSAHVRRNYPVAVERAVKRTARHEKIRSAAVGFNECETALVALNFTAKHAQLLWRAVTPLSVADDFILLFKQLKRKPDGFFLLFIVRDKWRGADNLGQVLKRKPAVFNLVK